MLLITLAFQIAETLLLPPGSGETSRDLLLRFVSSLAQGFLTVPYYIAVHRLVILGERTTSYALAPSNPRFQHFFWWWAALSVVTYLPISLVEMLAQPGGLAPFYYLIALAAMPIILIAIIIVTLRLTIIFPAVAVDAPGATWENAHGRHERLCVAHFSVRPGRQPAADRARACPGRVDRLRNPNRIVDLRARFPSSLPPTFTVVALTLFIVDRVPPLSVDRQSHEAALARKRRTFR